MKLINIALIFIALTMAFSLTLTINRAPRADHQETNDKQAHHMSEQPALLLPYKRLSRFLAEDMKNPRAADHCNQNNTICLGQNYVKGVFLNKYLKCCNNKCMDLTTDKNNCGTCKNKCKYTQECCRGSCVDIAFDKRHCGKCNNRCPLGGRESCIYGLCEYA